MRFYAETLGLSEAAFALLRELVHAKTGLYFDNGKSDLLADKLSPLVIERGFNSFLDYYYFLKYDSASTAEWERILDALAVPETFFWREADQIRALVDVIVPRFFDEHPGVRLRIWSAACASGEEPLSIAIALSEAGWLERAPIQLIASDASRAAIEKARRGVYRERSFRAVRPEWRDKYFRHVPEGWEVNPEMRARIEWQVGNLMVEGQVRPLANVHALFCRNVFIYFSQETIQKTARLFHRHMQTPGYLFVGASESLLRLDTGFELEEVQGAFVYVKRR